MSKFNADEFKIVRGENNDFPRSVNVYTPEGDTFWVVNDDWTDHQIITAIQFGLCLYDRGVDKGEAGLLERINKREARIKSIPILNL